MASHSKWYDDQMDSDGVIAALNGQPNGSFFIRPSSSQRGNFSLSYRYPPLPSLPSLQNNNKQHYTTIHAHHVSACCRFAVVQ